MRLQLRLPGTKAAELQALHHGDSAGLVLPGGLFRITQVVVGDEHSTDEQLIEAFYAGAEEALDELQTRYRSELMVMFKRLSIATQTAWDLVEGGYRKGDGVFERIRRTKESDRGRFKNGSFRTWILAIARNLAYDVQRSKARKGHEVPVPQNAEGEQWEPPAFSETEDVLLTEETRCAVHDCIEALPHREREAVAFFFFKPVERPTLKELGTVLDVSIPTASRALQSAYQKLRSCLESKGIESA